MRVDVPCAVGVPEMMPVVGEIESPAGREPEMMLQAYGVTPPAATREVVYGMPTSPIGCGPPASVSGGTGLEIVIDLFALTVNGTALVSVSCNMNGNVPVAVGVPDTSPVAALKDKPGGNVPLATQVFSGEVPPADTIIVEYAEPTMPAGGAPVMVGSGLTVMFTVSWLLVCGIAAISVTCIGDVIPAGAV